VASRGTLKDCVPKGGVKGGVRGRGSEGGEGAGQIKLRMAGRVQERAAKSDWRETS